MKPPTSPSRRPSQASRLGRHIIGNQALLLGCLFLLIVAASLLYYQSWAMFASSVLTFLYVYLYDEIEDRYFKPFVSRRGVRAQAVHWVILAHRLGLLLVFVFFESLFLTQWGLHPPEGSGIFTHFWLPHLLLLIWAFSPVSRLGLALSLKSRLVDFAFVAATLVLAEYIHSLGERPSNNLILQDATFAIVVAVCLGALVTLYDKFLRWLLAAMADN